MVSAEKGMSRYLDMLTAARNRGLVSSDIRNFHDTRTAKMVRKIASEARQANRSKAQSQTSETALIEKHKAEQAQKLVNQISGGCRLDYIPSVGNGL